MNWLNTSTGSPPAYKFAIQPGEIGIEVYVTICGKTIRSALPFYGMKT